jgi:hypothetical protein
MMCPVKLTSEVSGLSGELGDMAGFGHEADLVFFLYRFQKSRRRSTDSVLNNAIPQSEANYTTCELRMKPAFSILR